MDELGHDEQLLIEYLLGRCSPAEAAEVRRRLETDEAFAALCAHYSDALAALKSYPVPAPPAELVERTLARVRAMRRAEAVVQAGPMERPAALPLLSFRELLALAAVLVLAFGVLVPSLRKARQETQKVICGANVRMICTGLNHYASGNDEALPTVPAQTGAWLRRAGGDYASNSAGLFLLVRHNFVAPEAFQCPAVGRRSFTVRAGMVDFPSPQYVSYSYQYSLGRAVRRDAPELVNVAEQMAILADANPVFAGGRFRRDRLGQGVSENHRCTGQNVLYLSGAVRWFTHARAGVNGNNIWLADGIYDYRGDEKPTSPVDTFLLPHAGSLGDGRD